MGFAGVGMKSLASRQLLITYVPTGLILAAAAAASLFFHVRMSVLTADVAATGHLHPLTGVMSSLGILLWCAAASICGFAAMALRDRRATESYRFLRASALLSTYLMLDDAFQFHEHLASRYFGLDEKAVFAVLGTAVAAYLLAFKEVIRKTNYAVLLLAVGFLSVSVAIDAILEPWLWRFENLEYFFEDGAKWLGIASWCSYYVDTSYRLFADVHGPPLRALSPATEAMTITAPLPRA